MPVTATEYLTFVVVNFVVWPGFAGLYWYLFQREEESRMESMAEERQPSPGASEG
ncbi:MAG: hypothetical protein ABEI96_06715 [Haloarculaceae archaeon]